MSVKGFYNEQGHIERYDYNSLDNKPDDKFTELQDIRVGGNDVTYPTAGDSVRGQYRELKEDIANQVLIFSDVPVSVSAWTDDTTYESYPYKADIDCEGVTADYKPDVTYDVQEATSGVYAPVAQTGAGVVSIYASEIPVDVITIPTIMCVKAVSA